MIRDITREFTDAELAMLDDKVRCLVEHCVLDSNSYQATAELHGLAVGTVKSRIHRARAKIAALRAKNLVQRATESASAPIGHQT